MKPEDLRSWLKHRLTPEQRDKWQGRANRSRLLRWFYRNSLPALATLYGTNKWRDHWYAQHYQAHFGKFRNRPINLLEIGVGGFGDPHSGGESLRMWKGYFPRAQIFGVDIADKSALQEPRIRIFKGSQNDPEFLKSVAAQIGRIDIVIDDGSHVSEHIITSFETLFPALAVGGIYAIEDLQFSYCTGFGGSPDVNCQTTSMAMAKRLTDGLNWQGRLLENPSFTDRHVTSVHFYHDLVFICKGINDERGTMTATERHDFALEKLPTTEERADVTH